jgi:regulator of ribonuclease activity A
MLLQDVKTTDLLDEHPEAHSCETQFRSLGRRRAFHGRIRTIRCLEDNALVKRMVSQPGNGHVLVVDGGGSLRTALMGDVLAGLAAKNGWAGVVIHGAVRDVAAIAETDLGLKALGVNPRRSAKTGTGEVDVPVDFGGVTFVPGHWLYSDEDGVVIAEQPLGD